MTDQCTGWKIYETDGSSIVDGFRMDGHKRMDIKAAWNLHGLSGLQGTINENVLHLMINASQWNPNMGRISQNTCVYEDLPHKVRIGFTLLSKKRRSVSHYYKNPKPIENKVRIILSWFWYSRVVKIL